MGLSTPSRADIIFRKWEYLKTRKQNFELLYQQVAHFIYFYKQGFTTEITPGVIQNADIFDSQALRDGRTLAAFLRSLLWPSGTMSFSVVSAEFEDKLKEEVKVFFEYVTTKMRECMDSPRSGFASAMSEHLTEWIFFGTSGLLTAEVDDVVPVRYKAQEIKGAWIEENAEGLVDKLYRLKSYKTDALVEEYGIDNVSADARKAYEECLFDRDWEVLQVIEPRTERNSGKKTPAGVLAMPYAALHYQVKEKKLLRESGFEEFPVAVSRFYKAMGEEYGRSPVIDVLPDVVTLNALTEAVMIAMEKIMDPPIGVLDDGRFGGGRINTSPGAVNVFSGAGTTAPDKTVFPINTVGDIKFAEYWMDRLAKNIDNALAIDKLLDFNNQARMTAYEVGERRVIQGQALGDMLTRPEYELFTPTLDRTFNILLTRGVFGYAKDDPRVAQLRAAGIQPRLIPDAIVQRIKGGHSVYRIEYISPAKRLQMSELVNAIDNQVRFVNENANVIPDALDNYDVDQTILERGALLGISTKNVRSKDKVKELRDGRAAARQAQVQAEEQERQMRMVASLGQANAAAAQSGAPTGAMAPKR